MQSSRTSSTDGDHSYCFTKDDVTRASHDLTEAKRCVQIAEQTRDSLTQIKRPDRATELMKSLFEAVVHQLKVEVNITQMEFDEVSASYALSQQQGAHSDIENADRMETDDVTQDGTEPVLEPICITEDEYRGVFHTFLDQEKILRESLASCSTNGGDSPRHDAAVLYEKFGDALFEVDEHLRKQKSNAQT